ncbi:MAG: amidohydrolase family protein [Candidatus Aminicenantes bacterium]|nr:amidohydrolase family protein [Candidatus Aminicenantes bacterium]
MKTNPGKFFRLAGWKTGSGLFWLALVAWLWLLVSQPALTAAAVKPAYALVNCRLVTVSGPTIEKGTIVIRNGLIEAVGASQKIAIPADAEVIEAGGLTAYPGLISAHTNLFLEIKEPDQPQTAEDFMTAYTQPAAPQEFPELLIFREIKPKTKTVESWHRVGFTTVVVAPARGIFQGQSVILNLNSDQANRMVLKQPWALHINFTTERGLYPSSLMGTVAFIRQKFYDTQHYSLHLKKYLDSPRFLTRPEYDPFLEALVPFVVEKKPVVFQCNNQEDIKRALRLIDEFQLKAVLSGCNEAWRVTANLKTARIPLLVSLDFRPPATSLYNQQGEAARKKAEAELYPANAAILARENIPFALTSFGLSDTSLGKNLQAALKAGLSPEAALKALTIEPARILGLDQQLGTLEPGKMANLVLTRGDLFGEKTRVVKVLVDGILFNYEEKSQ